MDREERIDKYVSGQMDEVEKAAFESEMNQNEDFAADVRLRQEIVLAVRRKGVEDVFRAKEREIRSHSARKWLYLPSALLAACLVIGIFFRIGNVRDCKELGESCPGLQGTWREHCVGGGSDEGGIGFGRDSGCHQCREV